ESLQIDIETSVIQIKARAMDRVPWLPSPTMRLALRPVEVRRVIPSVPNVNHSWQSRDGTGRKTQFMPRREENAIGLYGMFP
ncbi:MAG TPA: hypothetical protein VK638_49220, partial [Edaphobacter sp.]|nr:hypothetical protein [Edaphobacter sp.]